MHSLILLYEIGGKSNMPRGAFADNPILTSANQNEETRYIADLNPLVFSYRLPSGTVTNQFPRIRRGHLTPEGFAMNLDGNAIPNAPELTRNLGTEHTWPAVDGVSSLADWDLTARVDYYYQADSYSRVWNTVCDKIDSWGNSNIVVRMVNATSDLSLELFLKI